MSAPSRALLALAGALALAARAGAQTAERRGRLQPEVRVDAILAEREDVHAGVGASIPAGTYLRVHLVGALGLRGGTGEAARTGRVDLLGRFVLDPFREYRWGPYGAAGVSQWLGPNAHTYLAVTLGVEGPSIGGYLPTLELGLGGGARVGVVARREIRGAR